MASSRSAAAWRLGGIGDRDKPIVLFDEFDSLAGEFALDKIVAVEVGGNGEGKKGADAQDHRSGDRVHDVKIKMGGLAALLAYNLVVGIGAGGTWVGRRGRSNPAPYS